MLLNLFYWCTNQQIIQRTFGASSLKEGQKGVLFAGLLKVLAPLILVLPGIIAFHLYAGEGIRPDHAYGTLVSRVLPQWLAGFFAAVMVGAILSSFNSALNSTATLFSLGVYQQMMHPDYPQERVIHAGKVFGWIIALAAMSIAPLLAGQESIFAYLQKMNGLYFIPIFAVVVVGMLSKRVPAIAANIALLVGFAAIALGYFVPTLSPYRQPPARVPFSGGRLRLADCPDAGDRCHCSRARHPGYSATRDTSTDSLAVSLCRWASDWCSSLWACTSTLPTSPSSPAVEKFDRPDRSQQNCAGEHQRPKGQRPTALPGTVTST